MLRGCIGAAKRPAAGMQLHVTVMSCKQEVRSSSRHAAASCRCTFGSLACLAAGRPAELALPGAPSCAKLCVCSVLHQRTAQLQVHSGVLHDGRRVVMKIQYPGVARSIESDVDNLMRIISIGNLLPKGLYVEDAAKARHRI